MAKKNDRRLVVCVECGAAYPGFRTESGEYEPVGGRACPDCGASEFAEAEVDT